MFRKLCLVILALFAIATVCEAACGGSGRAGLFSRFRLRSRVSQRGYVATTQSFATYQASAPVQAFRYVVPQTMAGCSCTGCTCGTTTPQAAPPADAPTAPTPKVTTKTPLTPQNFSTVYSVRASSGGCANGQCGLVTRIR